MSKEEIYKTIDELIEMYNASNSVLARVGGEGHQIDRMCIGPREMKEIINDFSEVEVDKLEFWHVQVKYKNFLIVSLADTPEELGIKKEME